eukprot:gene11142-13164_t
MSDSESDLDTILRGRDDVDENTRRLRNILTKPGLFDNLYENEFTWNFYWGGHKFMENVNDNYLNQSGASPGTKMKKRFGSGADVRVAVGLTPLATTQFPDNEAFASSEAEISNLERLQHQAMALQEPINVGGFMSPRLKLNTNDHIRRLVDRTRNVVEDRRAEIKRTQDALEASLRELGSAKQQEMQLLSTRVSAIEQETEEYVGRLEQAFQTEVAKLKQEHEARVEDARQRGQMKIAEQKQQCELSIQNKVDTLMHSVDNLGRRGSSPARPHSSPAMAGLVSQLREAPARRMPPGHGTRQIAVHQPPPTYATANASTFTKFASRDAVRMGVPSSDEEDNTEVGSPYAYSDHRNERHGAHQSHVDLGSGDKRLNGGRSSRRRQPPGKLRSPLTVKVE